MTEATCPICQQPLERKVRTFPFCSPRCRTIDLGNWLGEQYILGPQADADGGPATFTGSEERAPESLRRYPWADS